MIWTSWESEQAWGSPNPFEHFNVWMAFLCEYMKEWEEFENEWVFRKLYFCCGDASQQQAPGGLVKLEDKMNSAEHRKILEYNLIQSAIELWLEIRFSKIMAQRIKWKLQKCFKDNNVNVLGFLCQTSIRFEKGCSHPILVQHDRAWAVLQIGLELNCSVQMCRLDWDLSTQSQCCDWG